MPTFRMIGDRRLKRVQGLLGGQWMLLEPGDLIQGYLYRADVWEPHISRWISEQLRPGDVFLDVGANIGYYTLLAARQVGPSGMVVAFEPVCHRRIAEHVRLNRWRNVHVVPEAVGARVGSLLMGIASGLNRGVSSAVMPYRLPARATVPVTRIDERLRALNIDRVDVLKIDVEGLELEAFQGVGDLLDGEAAPRLVFELSPDFLSALGHTAQELKYFLAGKGYRLFYIRDAGSFSAPAYRLEPVDPAAPEPPGLQSDLVGLKPAGQQP